MRCYSSKVLMKNLSAKELKGLADAKFYTTPEGMRLLLVSAKILKKENILSNEITFTKKDFCNIIETKTTNKFDKLKKVFKELLRGYISSETEMSWKSFPMFDSILYEAVSDQITVRFHQALNPYLKNVRKDIKNEETLNRVMKFRSKYSVLIYDICKKNLNKSNKTAEMSMTIGELRKRFGIEEGEYKRYNDFKRKVLFQAQKEINEQSDICIEIEEETAVRKVIGIKFIIKRNFIIK